MYNAGGVSGKFVFLFIYSCLSFIKIYHLNHLNVFISLFCSFGSQLPQEDLRYLMQSVSLWPEKPSSCGAWA